MVHVPYVLVLAVSIVISIPQIPLWWLLGMLLVEVRRYKRNQWCAIVFASCMLMWGLMPFPFEAWATFGRTSWSTIALICWTMVECAIYLGLCINPSLVMHCQIDETLYLYNKHLCCTPKPRPLFWLVQKVLHSLLLLISVIQNGQLLDK